MCITSFVELSRINSCLSVFVLDDDLTGIKKIAKYVNRRGEEVTYETVGGSVRLGGNDCHYENPKDCYD
jgi:hypothetical protein